MFLSPEVGNNCAGLLQSWSEEPVSVLLLSAGAVFCVIMAWPLKLEACLNVSELGSGFVATLLTE